MIAFAILHKPSGGFLPHFGRRRGHTHAEVSTFLPPRLFQKEQHAKNALKYWLDGKWTETSFQHSHTGEYDVDLSFKPQPERQANEMEVVKVSIRIVRGKK